MSMQTPIEKVIDILQREHNLNKSVWVKLSIDEIKKYLLPYEKKYLRDVADKAWDESSDVFCGYDLPPSAFLANESRKQTYLNQNHPI